MVRRLVEDEEIWFLQHELAEDEPGGFAAGESLGGLERVVAAEEHLPHQSAQLLLIGAGIELPEPVDGGHAFGDGIAVILGEVSDGHFVSPDDGAAVDWELPIGILDM